MNPALGCLLLGSWIWLIIAVICDWDDFLEEYGWLIFLVPIGLGMLIGQYDQGYYDATH
jgi:hypothetical protein